MQRYTTIVLAVITMMLYGIESNNQCLKSSCLLEKDGFVRCRGITNINTLNHELLAIKECKVDNLKLELINFELEKLPRGIFNGTNINTLVFKNFSLRQLTDDEPGPSPFFGLEDSLHTLVVTGAKDSIRHWNWSELSKLRSLETLMFGRNDFSVVSNTFSRINNSSLSWLQITVSHVDEIKPNALGNFYQLEKLNLEGNMISYVTRASFPNLAPILKLINLNHNNLKILEEGTFSNMAALKKIYLIQNKFTVIQELVFDPIWDQLSSLLFYGNPIRCDCNMIWIINKTRIYEEALYCKEPTELNGTKVLELQANRIASECPRQHQDNAKFQKEGIKTLFTKLHTMSHAEQKKKKR